MLTPLTSDSRFRFRVSTNLRYGAGESEKLGEELVEMGYSKVAAIVDQGVVEHPQVKKALASVREAGCSLHVHKSAAVEPDYDYLESTKSELAGQGFQCLVGIGGGSAMDLAKGLATLLTNDGPALSYRGFPKLKTRPLPVIEIPTTAGTGSEVTYNAVFTDSRQKKKLGINSILNFPVAAIIDPLMTLDCPQKVAVSAGADAMVHTMESFITVGHTPMSRICSREAFRLLFPNLRKLADGQKDITIAGELALGAYWAGMALINSGGGIVGGFSYPLGVHYKVPHGIAGGIFLVPLTNWNVTRGYSDYAELYDMVQDSQGMTPKEKSEALVKDLQELWGLLGIPRRLSELGLIAKDVDFLAARYEDLKGAIALNPVSMSASEFAQLVRSMGGSSRS